MSGLTLDHPLVSSAGWSRTAGRAQAQRCANCGRPLPGVFGISTSAAAGHLASGNSVVVCSSSATASAQQADPALRVLRHPEPLTAFSRPFSLNLGLERERLGPGRLPVEPSGQPIVVM